MPSSGTYAPDTSLPMLISAPPCFFRCGSAAREPFTRPQKLMSKRRRASSSLTSSRRAYRPRPASFTQVSMRPKCSIAARASCSTCWRSETSQVTAIASPPAAVIRLTMSLSVPSLRAASTTLAPFFAAVSAVAKPMPLEAPVITMTCSFKGFSLGLAMICSSVNVHPRGRKPRTNDKGPGIWESLGLRVRALSYGSREALISKKSRAPDRINQLIQQVDMTLLCRNELVLNQLGAGGVDVVDAFFVILQAMLFAFLEALQAGGVAEQVGGALRELRPRAPSARRIG